MEFQEILEKRRSNRRFDPNTPVPDQVVEQALAAAALAPNSSNMQLWEFHWVSNTEKKADLAELCLGQSAAKTAQHLLVFVTRQDRWKSRAEFNLHSIKSTIDGEPNKLQRRSMQYYGKLMPLLYSQDPLGLFTLVRGSISLFGGLRKPFMRFSGKADQRVMLHKSCALAAENFMLSITDQGFDSCPMEGFDAWRVRRYLGLPRTAEINMIIGIGKGTPEGIYGPRFRVPMEQVVVRHH